MAFLANQLAQKREVLEWGARVGVGSRGGNGELGCEWGAQVGAELLCSVSLCMHRVSGSKRIVLRLFEGSGSCGRAIARTVSCPPSAVCRLPGRREPNLRSGAAAAGLGLEVCRAMSAC